MASSNLNVYAAEPAATGSVRVAPLGTTLPTDTSTALNAAFKDLGHVGESGITESTDRSIDKKKNFGGVTVKILQTDYVHTFKFTLLESLNAEVLKTIWGAANVTTTAATSGHGVLLTVKKTKAKLPKLAWVFDTLDSELGAAYRNCIPQGQIMTVDPTVIVHTDTIEYGLELEVFPDATGVHVYTYTDDGQKI